MYCQYWSYCHQIQPEGQIGSRSPRGLSTSPVVREWLRAASKGLHLVSTYGSTSQIVTHSWYGSSPQTSPSIVSFPLYVDYRNSTRPMLIWSYDIDKGMVRHTMVQRLTLRLGRDIHIHLSLHIQLDIINKESYLKINVRKLIKEILTKKATVVALTSLPFLFLTGHLPF